MEKLTREDALYPELPEREQERIKALIDKFKADLLKVAEETVREVYTDIGPYLESDTLLNLRSKMMDALCNPASVTDFGYDWKLLRRTMFEEYRDEIMAEMPEELMQENERLRRQLNARY